MRSSSTFSVLFWIYTQRADQNNEAKMYCRITVNGKKVNISLKQKVSVASWNSKRQKCSGNGVKSREINYYLDDIKTNIVQSFRELKSENKTLTAQLVKARYLGEDKREHSLCDIIAYHNKTMESKLAIKTMCHYRTSQKYVLAYLLEDYNLNDINLKDLNYAFVIAYESYLRTYEPDHYQGKIGNNAVMKHIQRLRVMIKLALNIDWLEKDPFVKFKPRIIKTRRDFLTQKELDSIKGLSIKIERLEVVRDLFLFSCYTGISYGDVVSLTNDNILLGIDGDKWIMANRNKNGRPFKIPILNTASQIIQKYRNHPRTSQSNLIMPKISNQRLNSYLKEVADLAKIEKNLTFHMARHTFATTVTLSNGVPIETVSKLLGHTKLATTQIYARVVESKISEDMNKLKLKLN